MVDLSSGAVLYAKDPDRRIPPASMAKMMTTHLAFHLIKQGELKLDKMCTVRPETWRSGTGRRRARPCSCRRASRSASRTCCTASSPCPATTRQVVLAECIAGTEPAFAAADERRGQAPRHEQFQFRQFERLAGRGRHLHHRARPRDARRSDDRGDAGPLQGLLPEESFTWGKTLGGGQPITQGNRNPLLGKVPGADGLKTGHTRRPATASPARPSRMAGA
jgi:D-alanyl-D-alanine carboxypeptidase (penicillin-binding protein 5/6)